MFENIDIFRIAHAMSKHAGARQAVIAQNMANADTPGYAAKDITPFQTQFESVSAQFTPRATRNTHLNGSVQGAPVTVSDRPGAEADPNGNSVSLETEMIFAVDTKRAHDRALAIYRTSLGILRQAIGRR
ncbi:MAG: FlgB family protein [Roseovarius sp.]